MSENTRKAPVALVIAAEAWSDRQSQVRRELWMVNPCVAPPSSMGCDWGGRLQTVCDRCQTNLDKLREWSVKDPPPKFGDYR